jgi:hypothetical protein
MIENVKILIENNANIEHVNNDARTPLHQGSHIIFL